MLPCAIKSATCGSIFDPARIRRELANIETKLADPALWNDPNASKPLMRERKRLESQVADDEELLRRTGDIEAYFELAREGEDVLADLERDIKSLATFAEELEARTMLNGEADPLNAIITVHPGAGGTESQDWAEMLLRMYLRWAEQQGSDRQGFVLFRERNDECNGLAFRCCPFNPVSPLLKPYIKLWFPVDRPFLQGALCIL